MTLVALRRHHFHGLSGFLRGEEEGGETEGIEFASFILVHSAWRELSFVIRHERREVTVDSLGFAKKATALLYRVCFMMYVEIVFEKN